MTGSAISWGTRDGWTLLNGMGRSAIVMRLDSNRETGSEVKHGNLRTYVTHELGEQDTW